MVVFDIGYDRETGGDEVGNPVLAPVVGGWIPKVPVAVGPYPVVFEAGCDEELA